MAEERVLFRQRFEEGLDGTTSNSYMLPDVEMYQSMVDELAQSSKKAYYLKQKFEMIQIAGRKKIIKDKVWKVQRMLLSSRLEIASDGAETGEEAWAETGMVGQRMVRLQV
ncbi:hypothetical protein ACOMHN_059437 [Nucella lapillus]